MAKKVKTYKSIIDYLESTDPEISALLKCTCADYSFNLKGKPGITFLLPKDPHYREKIAALAYSDNTDDVNKACDMLNALIIPDLLRTTTDWMNKRDDIPNSLRQQIEIQGIQGRDIKLPNGARISPDPNFADGSKKQNLAVWWLSGGEISTEGKAAQFKYAKKTREKKKVGGVAPDNEFSRDLRGQIAIEVENAYMFDRLGKSNGISRIDKAKYNIKSGEYRERDIYLEYTLSLINFILNVKADLNLFYGRVLPLISFQKIDFYYLFEPYKSIGEYFIPDYIIQEWYSQRGGYSFSMQKVIDQIGEQLTLAGKSEPAKCYTDRVAILTAVDAARMKIMQTSQTRPREITDHIAKVYDDLSANNRISGLQNIYPADLARLYAASPSLKILQDELRFLTFSMFEILETGGHFDRVYFQNILSIIAEYMRACGEGSNEERVLKLLNRNTLKYLISPTEKVNEIRIFLNSTYFLFCPLGSSEIINFPHKHVITRPDPNNLSIYNIHKAVMLRQKRLLDPGKGTATSDSSPTLAELLTLAEHDPKKLDPNVLATIRAIAAKVT